MKSDEPVDVCYILEGTYPYISGGVSTWIHQAISAMPNMTFSIVYIGSDEASRGDLKYEVPKHASNISTIYLFEENRKRRGRRSKLPPAPSDTQVEFAFDVLMQLIDGESDATTNDLAGALNVFQSLAARYSLEVFWKMPETWSFLMALYKRKYEEESFISFFWNAKFIVKPIWELLRRYSSIPEAKVYHSVCTGYAGFLAGVVKLLRKKPYLLSEHGIYVRERINDLLRTEWSPSLSPDFVRPINGISPFRQAWIDSFTFIGEFCYRQSDHITSLFERNASIQIEFGADPQKIEIIPNGIQPERFSEIDRNRKKLRSENPSRKTVGFLGRIVSIKDVRMLIRAARKTCDEIPDAHFLVAGPQDEDPEYFEGVCRLIEELNLKDNVAMPGKMRLDEALPQFDVMVLSSVSEGLPFAILESFAAEIPVVSTDVGSCSELIYGRHGREEDFGGEIVPVGDASALAKSLIRLLKDRDYQDRCGVAGKRRVNRDYREDDVMKRFHKLYQELATEETSLAT